MTARQYFQHEGRDVCPGDVLQVVPVVAAALKYRGLASLGATDRAIGTIGITGPPGESGPAGDAENVSPQPEAPRRRRYRRRDVAVTPKRADLTADDE